MKINVLNNPLNKEPDRVMEVTKEKFFTYFYKLLWLQGDQALAENEVKVLAALSARKDATSTGITKNNLPTVFKKLNEKGLMEGKELSDLAKVYQKKFTGNVEIVLNFKIKEDETGNV